MSYSATRSLVDRYINAAKDGYMDALQQATRRDLNTPDEDGMTAASWASLNGHLEALRLIVGRGGDVDRCDFLGRTPLHHAAARGLLHVVSFLVNWGANIFALDNDHHTALDLAAENSKSDVVQFLDGEADQQLKKNPKHVARLREKAVRQAEENIKRYEKLQEQAARQAKKAQEKRAAATVRGPSGVEEANHTKRKGIFQSVTMALRNKTQRGHVHTQPAGKSYSDIAGLTQGPKGGVAKKLQRRAQDLNGTISSDGFKVSDLDQSGKRTLRSAQGFVSDRSSEVMYISSGSVSDIFASGSSRPTAQDVFGGTGFRNFSHSKSRSEADLMDSGYGDDEEDNQGGIFSRGGFGNMVFLHSSKFTNTLQSFENDQGRADEVSLNGLPNNEFQSNDEITSSDLDGPSSSRAAPSRTPKELPWDLDEVDPLDDDEDQTISSPLEMLLYSEGLENYLHRFLQEKVDLDMLMKTKNLDGDLKEIGLPFGPRKKLVEAVQRRKEILERPKYLSDSYL